MNLFRKNKSKMYIVNLKENRVQFKDGNTMYGLWWSSGIAIKTTGIMKGSNITRGQPFDDIESALELIKAFHDDPTVKK